MRLKFLIFLFLILVLVAIYVRILIFNLQKLSDSGEKTSSVEVTINTSTSDGIIGNNISLSSPPLSFVTNSVLDLSQYPKQHDNISFMMHGSDPSKRSVKMELHDLKLSGGKGSLKKNRTRLRIPAMIDGKLKNISIKEAMNIYRRPLSYSSNALSHSFGSENDNSEKNIEKSSLGKSTSENSRCNENPNCDSKDSNSQEENLPISEVKHVESNMIKNDYEGISKPRSKESHLIKSENEESFKPDKSDEITSDYGIIVGGNHELENRNQDITIHESSISDSEENESPQNPIDLHKIFRRSTSITNTTNFTKDLLLSKNKIMNQTLKAPFTKLNLTSKNNKTTNFTLIQQKITIPLEISDGRRECHVPKAVISLHTSRSNNYIAPVSISRKEIERESIENSMVSIDFLTTLPISDWLLSGLDFKIRQKILNFVIRFLSIGLNYSEEIEQLKIATLNDSNGNYSNMIRKLQNLLYKRGTNESVLHVEGSPLKYKCTIQVTIMVRLYKNPDIYLNGSVIETMVLDNKQSFENEFGLVIKKVKTSIYPLSYEESAANEVGLLVIYFVSIIIILILIYKIACKILSSKSSYEAIVIYNCHNEREETRV